MSQSSDIPHEGLAEVTARMARAGPGRSVTLVAVSKTFGPDEIEPVIAAGQRVFGENRVQEAKAKWPALKARYCGLKLHLIGPLQSNKTAEAVALFDCIESLDRPKLAKMLAEEMRKQERTVELLVQVNTGQEPQKAGVAPDATEEFVRQCKEEHGLVVSGLMCIPPADEDPAPHFRMLRDIAARCGLEKLSMGMSGDFEIAIAEGATQVRVGSAIFGHREKAPSGTSRHLPHEGGG